MITNNKSKVKQFLMNLVDSKDPELLKIMLDNSTIVKTKNKEVIVKAGEISDTLYLIMSGVYRAFYTMSNDEEMTVVVAGENEAILSTPDMANPAENFCTYQTISPGELLAIPFTVATEIFKNYPDVYKVHSRMLSDSMTKQMELSRIRNEDALTRVKWLYESQLPLVGKIQKQYIANMLGMTQSTYSKTLKKYLETKEE